MRGNSCVGLDWAAPDRSGPKEFSPMKMTASAACAAVLTFASITGIGVAVAQPADQPYQQDRGQQGGYRQPGQGYGQQQTQTEQPGYTRRADGQQNQGQNPGRDAKGR